MKAGLDAQWLPPANEEMYNKLRDLVYYDRRIPVKGIANAWGFHITKTRLFKYIENFTTKRLKVFR